MKAKKPVKRCEFRGEQKTVQEIAATLGLTTNAIYQRLRGKQSVEVTLRRGPKPKLAQKPRSPRPARTYTFAGETMTLSEWSRETGISAATLGERLRQFGWTIERALTEPVMNKGQRALHKRNAATIRRMATAFSWQASEAA